MFDHIYDLITHTFTHVRAMLCRTQEGRHKGVCVISCTMDSKPKQIWHDTFHKHILPKFSVCSCALATYRLLLKMHSISTAYLNIGTEHNCKCTSSMWMHDKEFQHNFLARRTWICWGVVLPSTVYADVWSNIGLMEIVMNQVPLNSNILFPTKTMRVWAMIWCWMSLPKTRYVHV